MAIAEDEARHAVLGWTFVRWALVGTENGLWERAAQRFVAATAGLSQGGPPPETPVRRRLPPTAFKAVETVAGGFAGTAAGSKREHVFLWPKLAIGGLDLEGVLTVGDAGATTLGLGVLRHFVVRIARSPLLMTLWPGPTHGAQPRMDAQKA